MMMNQKADERERVKASLPARDKAIEAEAREGGLGSPSSHWACSIAAGHRGAFGALHVPADHGRVAAAGAADHNAMGLSVPSMARSGEARLGQGLRASNQARASGLHRDDCPPEIWGVGVRLHPDGSL